MASPDLLSLVAVHTDRLVATTRGLDDVAAPSLCEGWTRGHVASHVARNADGLVRLVRSAVDGTRDTMYGSREERNADIEAGAARSASELADDLERSAEALAPELARLHPEHADHPLERTPGDIRGRAADIPLMRVRELTWHHVDLDAGFGFADLEPELLALFLEDEVARLRDLDDAPDVTLRSSEGDEWTVGVGTAEVSGDRAALLGWLARGLTDGVTADPLPRLPAGR
ncbi:maleylpyruvate isomerase family mycothiol-dependent enzyme [Phycicoccus sonneratiae]|uniref:Maleylpyruvate isomerase family mycothiol-dependent enzyme n=1 Tax=Phycicoccus sonneratiae TaxID=2807628 RepID=A0ABS2CI08_9MICO|nr:maleylpyruvate isomerase family mycothiol-dependent enzyme [Phycicoccus sonneraticus]MBM6399512.1 maleylpyruvate isomerase family mycothiol-dependent enzyme [Phycicoccus sonneraticus]